MENTEITEEFSKKLRASYYFMGALLGKYGKAVMRSLSLLLLLAVSSAAYSQTSQKNHPEPAKMTPAMTEFWDPQPAVVDPGTACSAPSDAIVLFDGKDLSLWMAEDGSPALWSVHDGVMTVVKGSAGNIRTKAEFGSCQLHPECLRPVWWRFW